MLFEPAGLPIRHKIGHNVTPSTSAVDLSCRLAKLGKPSEATHFAMPRPMPVETPSTTALHVAYYLPRPRAETSLPHKDESNTSESSGAFSYHSRNLFTRRLRRFPCFDLPDSSDPLGLTPCWNTQPALTMPVVELRLSLS
jgi:hypothetical protein